MQYVTYFWKQISGGAEVRKQEVGKQVSIRGWVQTERAAHEAWADLAIRKPTAAALLHRLIAHMGDQNAVVIPQGLLAQQLNVSDRTVRTALTVLSAEKWIQIVRIGKGKECAYVINDRVAWSGPREGMRRSLFRANIIVAEEDQEPLTLEQTPLRRIPTIYPGESQLPSGAGLPPPSQPFLDGLEPDLPATVLAPQHGEEI